MTESDRNTPELDRSKNRLDSILGSIEALPGESPDLDAEIAEAFATELAARYGTEMNRATCSPSQRPSVYVDSQNRSDDELGDEGQALRSV
jgi:hypothetical protein